MNLKNMLDFLKNYQLSFLLPFLFQHESDNQVISERFGQNPWSFLILYLRSQSITDVLYV